MAKKENIESWDKIGQMIGKKVEKEFKNKDWKEEGCKPKWHQGGCGGLYFFGFIGALIYYIQTATGFWMGVLGVLKAIVWPGMFVYKLLGI